MPTAAGQTEPPRNVPLAGAWSPDGQRIAFAVVDPRPGDRTDDAKAGLWVMNADGSGSRRVARNAASSDPAWSPDGRRIAFRRFDRLGSDPNSDLYVVNADGSGLRRLTRHAANAALVRVVTRRADDRLPPQQGGVRRERRRNRGTEAHAAQRIVVERASSRSLPAAECRRRSSSSTAAGSSPRAASST